MKMYKTQEVKNQLDLLQKFFSSMPFTPSDFGLHTGIFDSVVEEMLLHRKVLHISDDVCQEWEDGE